MAARKPEAPEKEAVKNPPKLAIKVRDVAEHVAALRVQAESGNPPTVDQLDVLKSMVEAINT